MADPGAALTVDVHTSVPEGLTLRSLRSLADYIIDREGTGEHWKLAFLFTTNAEIQRMHREFMGLDTPTDIMTFPHEEGDFCCGLDNDGGLTPRGADIVISVEQAAAQAIECGWSTLDELWFLAIHGMLHLAGWDDHVDEQRVAMLGRQEVLLNGWKSVELARND